MRRFSLSEVGYYAFYVDPSRYKLFLVSVLLSYNILMLLGLRGAFFFYCSFSVGRQVNVNETLSSARLQRRSHQLWKAMLREVFFYGLVGGCGSDGISSCWTFAMMQATLMDGISGSKSLHSLVAQQLMAGRPTLRYHSPTAPTLHFGHKKSFLPPIQSQKVFHHRSEFITRLTLRHEPLDPHTATASHLRPSMECKGLARVVITILQEEAPRQSYIPAIESYQSEQITFNKSIFPPRRVCVGSEWANAHGLIPVLLAFFS
jgi:hypothetical protein